MTDKSEDWLYIKVQTGAPLTLWEWWLATFGGLIDGVRRFAWRARLTPKLRERCVQYIIDSESASGGLGIALEAERLAEYIARGEARR